MSKQVEWVYGIHAVQTLLKNASSRIQQLYLLKGRRDQRMTKLMALAEKQGVSYRLLSREKLDELADGNHQGVVAECSPGEVHDEAFLNRLLDGLDEPPFLLILDGVTDPHNLGACLRTAEAAGVHAVMAPKDNAASINPTVRKVASGAAELLPYVPVTNLARTLKALQERGIWLVGTTGEAEKSVFDTDLKGPLGIVMGAEGAGMRRLTREACDFLAYIPMIGGGVSSLNVSVAVGVCLYEAVRQRGLG
ncbi:23S rRNA (guanosine(2251)-2'-O)-methyltransferase RlmB [Gilvimarinus sp. F26214L]|uniref:23S rRNA (guanosine(2251)-2'-O)-methyltransferase RlmB n=1 Tax=Gilvimarinus sp. DZF01 TaxID=3461371 RepID=UPI0040451B93